MPFYHHFLIKLPFSVVQSIFDPFWTHLNHSNEESDMDVNSRIRPLHPSEDATKTSHADQMTRNAHHMPRNTEAYDPYESASNHSAAGFANDASGMRQWLRDVVGHEIVKGLIAVH